MVMQKRSSTPTADPAASATDFRWDDARVLLSLARDRSLKKAALRLGVDATTVGRRLDALETALDLHLFDRTTDGVRPTAAADELLPLAEDLERAALALRCVRAGIESEPEGVVRITAPPGLAEHMLVPLLPPLLARHPGLRITIDASIGYADLTRNEADLALRGARPTSGDLVATKLGTASVRPYAEKALVAELGRVRRFDALPWLTWGADLAHLPDARWLARHVPDERIVLRSSAMGSLVAAAKAGLGAVFLPDAFEQTTGLAPVRFQPDRVKDLQELPQSELWLIGHAAYRNVPRIAAVWDHLLEAIRDGRAPARRRGPSPRRNPS